LNIITSKPKVIWNSKTILGEGTLWVPSHNSIYFVDIKKKKIFTLNVKTNKRRIIKINKEIGFLAHIKKDIFILGLQSELRIVNLKNKETIRSIPIEEDKPLNRINDGKIDPKGRLWFGTMDNPERSIKNGSLYCLDKKLNIHKVDTKYYITNGPAFINAENFLHTDSRSKIIYKNFEKVMKTCFDLISECNCKEESNIDQESASDEWGGCPKCTFTTNYCQTKNKNLSKKSALDFFSIMCSASK